MNNSVVDILGTTSFSMVVTDTAGLMRTLTLKVYVAAIDPELVILGYNWARIARPDADWDKATWRWPVEYDRIEIASTADIDRAVQRGEHCFALAHRPHMPIRTDLREVLPTAMRVFAAGGVEPSVPDHLKAYADVFSTIAAGLLPEHGRLDHAIDIMPGKEVPYGPLYNLSAPELDVLRAYIEDATAKGWIRRSTSPAGAPVLFVPKKDGGLRLCVDYRGLNNVTIKNRHPLPLISETLDRLGGAAVFTKLDLKDAYHRIRIKKGDEWKTAFRTRYGHFEYMVMPFGLSNAPATFQAYISQALVGLVDTICVIYLDDILIYSADTKTHHADVAAVLDRLRAYKLYAGLKKCEFDKTQVDFLGFTISTVGISMETSRVETLTGWPEPKSFHDLQVFLGFANFYRRFIEGYSRVVKPMTDMLKGMQAGRKKGDFDWTDAQKASFAKLKELFTSEPILRHFNPSLRIMIETDASDFAIGAILSQKEGDSEPTTAHWHPVAYYSRKMIDAETRYPTHEGEMLAIDAAFKHWRHYLKGAQHTILVRTDHDSLKHFMTKKELNRRQARWAERLASFDFEIEYRQGKTNPADGLSRRPDYESTADHAKLLLPTLRQKLGNIFMLNYGATAPVQATSLGRESVPQVPSAVSLLLCTKAQGLDKGPESDGLRSESAQGSIRCSPLLGPTEGAGGDSQDRDRPGHFIAGISQVTPWSHQTHEFLFESLTLEPSWSEEEAAALKDITREAKTDGGEQADQGRDDFEDSDYELPTECATDDEDPTSLTWEDIKRKEQVPRQVIQAITRGRTAYDQLDQPLEIVLREAQKTDPFVLEKQWEKGSRHQRPEHWATDSRGLLRHKGRVYVPPDSALRQELLRTSHDDPHSSHFGAAKTTHMLRRHYYWETMAEDVRSYVQTCPVCQRTKTPRHLPYGKLSSLPRPTEPWCEISMDFITDLPESPDGDPKVLRDSILVVVDRYTKMSIYIATNKTITAEELAEVFLQRVVRSFGLPKGIVSDRGSVFTSKFWSELCFHLKITRRLSTAFHPQTDGQTERQNQTLEHYLRCYCNYRQDDWVSRLAMAEFTYNNSVHSTTGTTPFRALYGFDPTMRLHPDNMDEGDIPEVNLRIKRMAKQREELSERWRRAVESYEKFHDKRHIPIEFKVGDLVMLNARNIRQKRPSKKLADRLLGPFKILQIVGNHKQAYKLELPETWRIHPVFHVSLLERYHRRPGTTVEPTAVEVDSDGDEHWEVEAILADRKSISKGTEYLVRWKDFPPAYDSWVRKDLFDDSSILKEYERTEGAKQAASKRLKTKAE